MRKKMSFLIVVSLVATAFALAPMNASAGWVGDVTILSDGTVVPADAPISVKGMIYTQTDDIFGTITIEKSEIKLDGAGYSIIGAWGGSGVRLISMSGVTLKNLDVDAFFNGFYIRYSYGIIVEGSTISNCYRGIYLSSSYHTSVKGSSMLYNYLGIQFSYSDKHTIMDNTFTGNFYGTYLSRSHDNVIKMNDLQYNVVAYMSWHSTGNRITLNTVVNNEHGIVLNDGSNNNVIHKNTVVDNENSVTFPWPSSGIYLQVCSGNVIMENTVYSNQFGFWLWVATDNIIKENTIIENDLGFRIENGSDGNTLHTNNIIDNVVQAQDNGINTWNNGAEGNYWSDYMGMDLDNDGVGDTDLPHQGLDWFPLMNPC